MRQAIVIFPSDESYSNVKLQGYILFTQFSQFSPVSVEVNLQGLSSGKHGFHVHEKGIPKGVKTIDCKILGGHFNPYSVNHGSYSLGTVRHAGDLINNLDVNSDGLATVNFIDTLISLYPGKNSIVGRSIVIHQDSDDEGIPGLLALQSGKKLNKKEIESLKTGNACNRIACGNIKLV